MEVNVEDSSEKLDDAVAIYNTFYYSQIHKYRTRSDGRNSLSSIPAKDNSSSFRYNGANCFKTSMLEESFTDHRKDESCSFNSITFFKGLLVNTKEHRKEFILSNLVGTLPLLEYSSTWSGVKLQREILMMVFVSSPCLSYSIESISQSLEQIDQDNEMGDIIVNDDSLSVTLPNNEKLTMLPIPISLDVFFVSFILTRYLLLIQSFLPIVTLLFLILVLIFVI